jgi:hypothetical protein
LIFKLSELFKFILRFVLEPADAVRQIGIPRRPRPLPGKVIQHRPRRIHGHAAVRGGVRHAFFHMRRIAAVIPAGIVIRAPARAAALAHGVFYFLSRLNLFDLFVSDKSVFLRKIKAYGTIIGIGAVGTTPITPASAGAAFLRHRDEFLCASRVIF